MTARADDDALSWAGDDDPTLTPSGAAAQGVETRHPAAPETEAADGATDDGATDDDAEGEADAAALSSAALISLGVLGGIYLLYTIGWVVGGLRLRTVTGLLVDASVSVPALIFAIAAPAIWFLTAYVLTRGRATWLRFAWLAAGAVLLVPWPFAMLGFGG